jgi:hypothetical protein
VAKEAKAAATKALELAAANKAVVVAASALALQLGDEPGAVMKGVEITLAVKFVYVAFPLQPTPKPSHSSKAAGLTFLGGLGARWPTFVPAARAACVAASVAASAADAAADVAAAAAASLAPPAAPIVLPASNTAAAIDLGAMSEAEQRALLARLVGLQAALYLPCSAHTRGCLFPWVSRGIPPASPPRKQKARIRVKRTKAKYKGNRALRARAYRLEPKLKQRRPFACP